MALQCLPREGEDSREVAKVRGCLRGWEGGGPLTSSVCEWRRVGGQPGAAEDPPLGRVDGPQETTVGVGRWWYWLLAVFEAPMNLEWEQAQHSYLPALGHFFHPFPPTPLPHQEL